MLSVVLGIVMYFCAHSKNFSQLKIRYNPAHYVGQVSCVALKNDYYVFYGSDRVQCGAKALAPPQKKK